MKPSCVERRTPARRPRGCAASARPKRGRGVDGGLAGLDPAEDQAVVVDARAPRARRPPSAASPSQRSPRGLGGEEALGRVRQGLHQRGGAVAEPQPGGGADVAAGDRGRGDHRRAEELLGAAGDQRLPGHGPLGPGLLALAARRRAGLLVRSTMREHLLESGVPTVVRVRHVAPRVRRGRSPEQPAPGRSRRRRRRGCGASMASTRSMASAGRRSNWRARCRVASYPARSGWRRRAGPSGRRRASRRCRSWSTVDPVGEPGVGEPRLEHDVRPSASGRCCRGRPPRRGSARVARAAGQHQLRRPRASPNSRPTIQVTIVITIAPPTAVQKPSTWKPRSNCRPASR